MPRKGYFSSPPVISWEIERELAGGMYAMITVDIEGEVEPGGGDGINEPRYPPSAGICSITVTKILLDLPTPAESIVSLVDVQKYGSSLEVGKPYPWDLGEQEKEIIHGLLMERSWVEPEEQDKEDY